MRRKIFNELDHKYAYELLFQEKLENNICFLMLNSFFFNFGVF